MKKMLVPIAALLLSDALLLIGHGLQLTLLPVSAEMIGFSAGQIGVIGSTYFIGFVTGCIITPLMVRRVGHIRAFAVLATTYSAVILLFHSAPYFPAWLLLRYIVGVVVAGLYMIIESWLNERATAETRGTILSIYTFINLTMITAGQQLMNLANPSGHSLFALAAILISLAIVPVSLTSALAPAPIRNVKIDLRKVWRISKVGMGGAVVSGLVTGAFWSLGPVYARGIGLDTLGLAIFMSIVVLGGAAFQLPLGRISDHYDRRLVVFFSAVVGAALSILLVMTPAVEEYRLATLAFLWGGCVMTLYAVCLAHANDRADPEDFVMVGSAMLLSLGLFSAVGSIVASALMALTGPSGLFLFSAFCLLALAIGTSARRQFHVLPFHEETEPFQLASGTTTPMGLELDPRTEEHREEEAAPPPNVEPD